MLLPCATPRAARLHALAHVAALGPAGDEGVGDAARQQAAEQAAQLQARHAERGRPRVRHALGLRAPPAAGPDVSWMSLGRAGADRATLSAAAQPGSF